MANNEYMMIRSLGNPGRLFPKIQKKEQEGWELVSILPFTMIGTIGYTIIMRRARNEAATRNT